MSPISIGEEFEATLTRQGKREAVVSDIRGQIADGRLKPGDKLLSISVLCSRYGVSHQTAAFAMSDLVREGIIVSQPRRGYFVAPAAAATATAASRVEPASGHPVFDAADKLTQVFNARRRVTTLSFFVMDNLPEHVMAWRAAFAAFEQEHPLIRVVPIFPSEGNLLDVLRRRTVDIAHAPHDELFHSFQDQWEPVNDLRTAGLSTGEMLPIVNAIQERDRFLMGAPLSLTTRYLYVNLDLYHRLHPGPVEFTTPDAILETALEFERSAAGPGEFGLWPDKLFEDLVLLEAIIIEPGGRFHFNEPRLRALIPRLAQLRCLGAKPHLSTLSQTEQFRAKRALFCWQFSFNMPSFDVVPGLNWTALAPPSRCDSPTESYLTVLATSRHTDFPDECRELVRFLCSEPVMERLARPPVLLPARRRLLDRWEGSPRMSRGMLQNVAARFSPYWPVMDHPAWDRVDTCGYRLMDGTLKADALFEALQPRGEAR